MFGGRPSFSQGGSSPRPDPRQPGGYGGGPDNGGSDRGGYSQRPPQGYPPQPGYNQGPPTSRQGAQRMPVVAQRGSGPAAPGPARTFKLAKSPNEEFIITNLLVEASIASKHYIDTNA